MTTIVAPKMFSAMTQFARLRIRAVCLAKLASSGTCCLASNAF